jgi:hypothetical protein
MSFESEGQSDLRAMIEEFGSTWTWEGNEYDGVQGDKTSSTSLEVAGFEEDITFPVHFVKEDFDGTYPESGDTITGPDSVNYRILKVTTSEADPGLQIECGSIDK